MTAPAVFAASAAQDRAGIVLRESSCPQRCGPDRLPRVNRLGARSTAARGPFALAALFVLFTGCGESGDPVTPSESVTGRWKIPTTTGTVTLELQELGGDSLAGRFFLADRGTDLGESRIRNGVSSGGRVSFQIDPLDPPNFSFLEQVGSVAILHYSGGLDTRETLVLNVDQNCTADTCLDATVELPLATPIYTRESQLSRPLGRGGSFANLNLVQVGSAVTGSLAITFGDQLGGVPTQPLPIREGSVDSINVIRFFVDPTDDPLRVLADSIHCAGRIHYEGRLEQGSTVRFTIRQDTTAAESVCVAGSTTWPARPVFDNYRDTLSVEVHGTSYDVALATTQEGSVLTGTAAFENDEVREGPFTIENGRFSDGTATFSIRPVETESVEFLQALGSASPIDVEMRILGGTDVRVEIDQQCRCTRGVIAAPRIRIGL